MAIMNTQSIKVPIDSTPPFEYIIAKQGEISSRQVEVTLLQNNAVYTIPSGVKARVKYYKPDGNKVINDCTISNNKVIVTYTQQMLAAAGTGFAEIQLYSGSSVLVSATYYTKIAESVYTDDAESTDESTSLTKLIIETEQARDSAQAARTATEKLQTMPTQPQVTQTRLRATPRAQQAQLIKQRRQQITRQVRQIQRKKQPTKQPQTQREKQKTRKTPRAQQTGQQETRTRQPQTRTTQPTQRRQRQRRRRTRRQQSTPTGTTICL